VNQLESKERAPDIVARADKDVQAAKRRGLKRPISALVEAHG